MVEGGGNYSVCSWTLFWTSLLRVDMVLCYATASVQFSFHLQSWDGNNSFPLVDSG